MKKKEGRKLHKNKVKKSNTKFNYKIFFYILILLILIFAGVFVLLGRFPLFNPGDSVTRSFNDSEIHVGEWVNVTLRMVSNSQGVARTFQINEYLPASSIALIIPCQGGQIFGTDPDRYIKFGLSDLPDGTTDLCYSMNILSFGTFSFDNSNYAFREGGSAVASGSVSGERILNIISSEICDGIDNDQNGLIDDGSVCFTNVYCDNDTDTFFDKFPDGNCSSFNCVSTNCRATIGDDCNDTNSTINPSATEICDSIDNNCDDLVDNGNLCSEGLTCENGLCVQPNCNSVWAYYNTSCNESDVLIGWYKDTNCSVVRANETYDCDNNSNGIIGNVSDIKTLRVGELEMFIDGKKFNWSKDYSDDEYEVEFLDEDENVLVSFEYDFEDDDALNLKKIYLEKQRLSSDFGYFIVEGLAGINKILLVDKIDSASNYVCVRDKEILDVDDFTDGCTGSKEYWVKCPGNNSRYKCLAEGSAFSVLGVRNSAIKELLDFTPIDNSDDDDSDNTCVSRFECSWSSCVNNIQTYHCTDLNNCGGINPGTNQLPRACNSSNIGTTNTVTTPSNNSGNQNPSKTDKGKIIFYVLLAVIIFVFLLILVIFFVQYSKKRNQGFSVPVRYS